MDTLIILTCLVSTLLVSDLLIDVVLIIDRSHSLSSSRIVLLLHRFYLYFCT